MRIEKDILWNYIDTEKAAIKVLSDYRTMKRLERIVIEDRDTKSDINRIRLEKVREYLNWFEPSWNSLSDEEQSILKEFYMKDNLKSGAGTRLQFKFNYSERQLHRIKAGALVKLSKYLFGK